MNSSSVNDSPSPANLFDEFEEAYQVKYCITIQKITKFRYLKYIYIY